MTNSASRGGDGLERVQPPYLFPDYASTILRSPQRPLVALPEALADRSGPVYGHLPPTPLDADLTRQHQGEPLGERIIVAGKVTDSEGRPVRNQLMEVWQANAAGRYAHRNDVHPAPLDPNFTGGGRLLTDDRGEYRFVTIKPGSYPWANHPNAWRPAHIHFSLFGNAFSERLVTQMYFPGDPLMSQDPISLSLPTEARPRLVSTFAMDLTVEEWALGYRFDIVLDGVASTPFEPSEQP
ncbi:MAG: protocatechuate 3,4-dioxygenase subunit beta [Candidatus Dormiibacterota bacterium]